MLTILRLFLFALSSLGFWELFRRRFRIHVCFLPSLTVALQTCFLLAGGILNLLWISAWVTFGTGILFLIYYIWKDKGLKFLRSYFHVSYLLLLILSILLLVLLYGRLFSHYDNFSHWALVVKQMYLTDRFPNFQDTIIQFQDYPLGSSAYIYYVAKIVSGSESVQMFAQAYVMITCMMPLLFFVKTKKTAANAAALVLALGAGNFFLVYNIALTDLLVDTLLPLAAGCSFLYAWEYAWKRPAGKGTLGFLAGYLIWLVQIKNVGFFFAAFIMIGVLIGIRKDHHVLARIQVVLSPIFSAVIWKCHCSYVFPDAAVSKHAMSLDNYASVVGEKDAVSISNTVSGVLRFSVSYHDVWAVFGMVLLLVIAVCIFVKQERKNVLLLAGFSLLLYITYQLGLTGMYIFSMPETEASYLAEIERYTKLILIVVVYLWVLMVIRLMSGRHLPDAAGADAKAAGAVANGKGIKTWVSWAAAILSCGLLTGVLLVSFGEIRFVGQYTENLEERQWLEEQTEAYDIPYGSSYFIFPKQEDGAYSYYLGMFLFYSPYVDEVFVDEPEDLEEVWGDYIFVFDEGNPIIEDWVAENYPEQVGEAVIECKEQVEDQAG